MVSSRFQIGIALRIAALLATVTVAAWTMANTQWYVASALLLLGALLQGVLLTRFATESNRQIARFLDAVAYDDMSRSFSSLSADRVHRELGAAMTRVIDRLRAGRAEREEQARFLQSLVDHVPVALLLVDEAGCVQLLNTAARRLFESPLTGTAQFARHGDSFAVGIQNLRAGDTAILRMERISGTLQLKGAATELTTGGERRRLISMQNIENEMSAQEMAAWQTVIRVMAHEMMNSLTPISSLAGTARELLDDVLKQLPAGAPQVNALVDAQEALETVAQRSDALLHFVQNHRRLTKRMATQIQIVPVRRIFVRIQRLLANDLAARDIHMTTHVEPETLELAADADLLDQALINLVRNSIDALNDVVSGKIILQASRDSDGHIAISVTDNGPGIASDQREKVFVPFFTTKRHGSGIGLTLVRQIATAHGARVTVAQADGGGAVVSLRF